MDEEAMQQNPYHSRREVRDRELTETIRITSRESIPEGYRRIPVPSSALYGKAQVLSSRYLKPIFVETALEDESRRVAFWVHSSIVSELSEWIQRRIFSDDEILGTG